MAEETMVQMVANRSHIGSYGHVRKGHSFAVSEREAASIERARFPLAHRAPGDDAVGEGLPEDFPGRALLLAAGLASVEQVAAANDEDLLALKGIGPASLAEIRNYKQDA